MCNRRAPLAYRQVVARERLRERDLSRKYTTRPELPVAFGIIDRCRHDGLAQKLGRQLNRRTGLCALSSCRGSAGAMVTTEVAKKFWPLIVIRGLTAGA